jgi:hypothetical protein
MPDPDLSTELDDAELIVSGEAVARGAAEGRRSASYLPSSRRQATVLKRKVIVGPWEDA